MRRALMAVEAVAESVPRLCPVTTELRLSLSAL
jgi:hypothetical protein